MNVSSSQSFQSFQSDSSSSNSNTGMSSYQTSVVEDILSNYDADSLSESDAKEIAQSFQEAGINPTQELATVMAASGFDAQEVGKLAGVGPQGGQGGGHGQMGPPPPPSEEEITSITDLLESLFSSEEDSEDSDDSSTASSSSSDSFESILEYTDRILRLNDESKGEVMDILQQYEADNTESSQEDVQQEILSSMTDILTNTENYKRMSFYV